LARPDEFPPRAFPRPWSQILRNSSGDGERLPARGETISRGVRKRERAGGGRTIAFAGSESTNSGREPRALASRTSGWGRESAGFRPWFAPRCGTTDLKPQTHDGRTTARREKRDVSCHSAHVVRERPRVAPRELGPPLARRRRLVAPLHARAFRIPRRVRLGPRRGSLGIGRAREALEDG
jgi:hypothetical protein